ncbi:unnamed protein product [Ceutorhynchus assimilis]|uniref:Uncharacterized protein n=1 Tax=Ceutorhynchus assimilis TaxID=467358 RepID=A0A9N9MQA8_9CUCU|nr:unnamed protein product [Ceutorhynchus assimilis]
MGKGKGGKAGGGAAPAGADKKAGAAKGADQKSATKDAAAPKGGKKGKIEDALFNFSQVQDGSSKNVGEFARQTGLKEHQDEPDVKEIDMEKVPVRVDKINVEGLGRTKNDIVEDCIRELFKAKDFQDVLLKAHRVTSLLASSSEKPSITSKSFKEIDLKRKLWDKYQKIQEADYNTYRAQNKGNTEAS